MNDHDAYLKKIVADLQATVNKERSKSNGSSKERAVVLQEAYPAAKEDTDAKQVGLIVDDKFSVEELAATNKITAPDKLRWLQLKTYDEFEAFITKRGIPAYISFDGDLGTKGKDGLTCAKFLVKFCEKNKIKDLPQWECHSPTITSKAAIESVLIAY